MGCRASGDSGEGWEVLEAWHNRDGAVEVSLVREEMHRKKNE